MTPEYRFPLKRKRGFLHIGTSVSNLRNWGVKPSGILRQTFLEKRTQARMERALVLLGQPDQTVTSVSNTLGYSSPEHFSGAFRKYFGTSPKNFLKKC